MAQGAKLHHVDTSYHLQQASNAFFANRWILQDHQILIATRPKSLAKVRTTVACFAAGHRAFYKKRFGEHGRVMDVAYRKLRRGLLDLNVARKGFWNGKTYYIRGTNWYNISQH